MKVQKSYIGIRGVSISHLLESELFGELGGSCGVLVGLNSSGLLAFDSYNLCVDIFLDLAGFGRAENVSAAC